MFSRQRDVGHDQVAVKRRSRIPSALRITQYQFPEYQYPHLEYLTHKGN